VDINFFICQEPAARGCIFSPKRAGIKKEPPVYRRLKFSTAL